MIVYNNIVFASPRKVLLYRDNYYFRLSKDNLSEITEVDFNVMNVSVFQGNTFNIDNKFHISLDETTRSRLMEMVFSRKELAEIAITQNHPLSKTLSYFILIFYGIVRLMKNLIPYSDVENPYLELIDPEWVKMY